MSRLSPVLQKLRTLRARPHRIVDWLREPRGLFAGGPISNRAGLQVLRVFKERAMWRLRNPQMHESIRPEFEQVERDGILVIPNFLPERDFALLRAEYEKSRTDPARAHVPYGENFMTERLHATEFAERYPHAMRLFRDNDFLLNLASAISRRRRTYKPHVEFFTAYKPEPDKPHVDLDPAQFVHPDRHYPFMKAFFYLNDVEADNMPYSYARGSHRLSLERLRFEYEHSITWATKVSARGQRTMDELRAYRILTACVEESMRRQGTSCDPVVGRANTLVISNNQGFHKRGALRSGRSRELVYIDFKYLESTAQWMYPVLRRIYPRERT